MKREAQPINTRGDGKQRVDMLFEPRFSFYFCHRQKGTDEGAKGHFARVYHLFTLSFFLVLPYNQNVTSVLPVGRETSARVLSFHVACTTALWTDTLDGEK